MRNSGLRKNDPRLNDFINNLKKVHKNSGSEGGSPETQKLNRETFKRYGLQYVITFLGISVGKPYYQNSYNTCQIPYLYTWQQLGF